MQLSRGSFSPFPSQTWSRGTLRTKSQVAFYSCFKYFWQPQALTRSLGITHQEPHALTEDRKSSKELFVSRHSLDLEVCLPSGQQSFSKQIQQQIEREADRVQSAVPMIAKRLPDTSAFVLDVCSESKTQHHAIQLLCLPSCSAPAAGMKTSHGCQQSFSNKFAGNVISLTRA